LILDGQLPPSTLLADLGCMTNLEHAVLTNALSNAMPTEQGCVLMRMNRQLLIALGCVLTKMHCRSFVEPHRPYQQGT